jgi:hypothetical protein
MKEHPNLKTYVSGQTSALKRYGFGIWDLICGEKRFYESFKLHDAASLVQSSFGMSSKTAHQYTSAVLHNVYLDQDHENPCLEKRTAGWRLLPVEYN